MDQNQEEFAQEEDDGAPLLNIPQNMRPPLGAEVLQRQESQPVSQSGGGSTVEEAKEESTEGENLREEDFSRMEPKPEDQQATKGKRKAPSNSSAEKRNTDPTDRAVWSRAATIVLLEAHQKEFKEKKKKKKVLKQHRWESVIDAVNATKDTGTSMTLEQCRSRYHTLKRQKEKDSKSNSTIATVSILEWYLQLQTHKIFEWDTNATIAMLEAHWEYLEPRIKPGQIVDKLNNDEWNAIAATLPDVTGAQCRDKTFELVKMYCDQYIGMSASSKWVYKYQIERLIKATLLSSYSSSNSDTAAGGSQSAHP